MNTSSKSKARKQVDNGGTDKDSASATLLATTDKTDFGHPIEKVTNEPPDQKLKIGDMYIVEKKFEKQPEDEDELSVEKGERVQIKELRGYWCKVKSLRNGKEGFVPCENISPGGKRFQYWIITHWITQWIIKHWNDSRNWIVNHWIYLRITEHLNNNYKIYNYCGFFTVIIIIAWYMYPTYFMAIDPYFKHFPSFSPKIIVPSPNEIEVGPIDLKIDELEGKYTNLSDDIWSKLSYCLENTLTGKQPCIILMLNGGEDNFSKLLNDIGDLSVEVLKGSSNDMEASKYLLKGSTITKSEENYSFEHYKSKLKENKVLLIDELEMVPGKMMENFHSLCDVYDAAVKQAVIVFLLNYNDITADLNNELNDATLAIDILSDLWKNSIHHDLINPLAIRVAENVVHLQPRS